MKSTQVRMNVYTSTGYDSDDIPTLDHSDISVKRLYAEGQMIGEILR